MRKLITTAALVTGMAAIALPVLAAGHVASVDAVRPPAGDTTIEASLDIETNGGVTFCAEAEADLLAGTFVQIHELVTPGHTSGDGCELP